MNSALMRAGRVLALRLLVACVARKAVWVCILPLCFLSLACAEMQRPTASVQSVAVRELTPTGFTLDFNVELQNPNTVALPMANTGYRLQLAGAKVLEGSTSPDGAIPAKGVRAVVLPVNVNFEDLLAAAEGIRQSGGDIPYALDATFEFDNGLALLTGPIRLPVSYRGTLRMQELLKDPLLLLRSPAARKLAQQLLGRSSGE